MIKMKLFLVYFNTVCIDRFEVKTLAQAKRKMIQIYGNRPENYVVEVARN